MGRMWFPFSSMPNLKFPWATLSRSLLGVGLGLLASEIILETIDRRARVRGQKGLRREPETGEQTNADDEQRP